MFPAASGTGCGPRLDTGQASRIIAREREIERDDSV